MNIHPIFVHFPIALLTLYAFMEILRFKSLNALPYYFYVKASFLILGTITSYMALWTGGMAEDLVGGKGNKLIETHSTFATISVWIFTFLALVYLIVWISQTSWDQKFYEKYTGAFAKARRIKVAIATKILASPLPPLLALAGLITITITGALGGAIVYGQDVDPVVKFIYNLVM